MIIVDKYYVSVVYFRGPLPEGKQLWGELLSRSWSCSRAVGRMSAGARPRCGETSSPRRRSGRCFAAAAHQQQRKPHRHCSATARSSAGAGPGAAQPGQRSSRTRRKPRWVRRASPQPPARVADEVRHMGPVTAGNDRTPQSTRVVRTSPVAAIAPRVKHVFVHSQTLPARSMARARFAERADRLRLGDRLLGASRGDVIHGECAPAGIAVSGAVGRTTS